jgi:hypothetical protein
MRATHQGPRVVARLMITIGVLLTVIISLPRGSSAVDVTDDQAEYISDVERFPGWKGTLPGIKNDESALDPNRVRTVASGSLGQARALPHSAVSQIAFPIVQCSVYAHLLCTVFSTIAGCSLHLGCTPKSASR